MYTLVQVENFTNAQCAFWDFNEKYDTVVHITIALVFAVQQYYHYTTELLYPCYFLYCLLLRNGQGGWSEQGLHTNASNGSNYVACESTHLTSFVVLVEMPSNQVSGVLYMR